MTDRAIGLAWIGACLNVRRLMYQWLIWVGVSGDDPRRLRSPGDTQDLKRLSDTLIDGMWRDTEFGGDLLGTHMLANETQTVELPGGQARYALCLRIVRSLF